MSCTRTDSRARYCWLDIVGKCSWHWLNAIRLSIPYWRVDSLIYSWLLTNIHMGYWCLLIHSFNCIPSNWRMSMRGNKCKCWLGTKRISLGMIVMNMMHSRISIQVMRVKHLKHWCLMRMISLRRSIVYINCMTLNSWGKYWMHSSRCVN